MTIRMILTDLDGTLFGADRLVSKDNQRSLKSAQARGILVVPASGRTFRSVKALASSLGLTGPVISCNGARVDASVDGPTILRDVFSPEDASRIAEALFESDMYFALYGDDVIYRGNAESVAARAGRGLSLLPNGKVADDEFHASSRESMEKEGLSQAYKFVVFAEDAQKLHGLRGRIDAMGIAEISSSWTDNIEILKKGAGKGRALKKLCEAYGILPEETMAFGDQLNDLSMLKSAGVPVAMENAVGEVKRVARISAPHHDKSGVGRVIEKYLCGELSL